MVIRIILCFAFLLFSCPASGEEISLRRAIEMAIGHAPAMKSAEAGRDVARQDINIAAAALLPRVDVTGSLGW